MSSRAAVAAGQQWCVDCDRRNNPSEWASGIIGGAVISGTDQWIYSDIYGIDLSPTNSTNTLDVQSNVECQHQFHAGIKTIASISLPSLGVAQFGSPQKIPEKLEFVIQVKHSLEQVESIVGFLPHGVAHKALTIHGENAASASANSSGAACNCYDNTNSFHRDISEKYVTNTEPLRGHLRVHPTNGLQKGILL